MDLQVEINKIEIKIEDILEDVTLIFLLNLN